MGKPDLISHAPSPPPRGAPAPAPRLEPAAPVSPVADPFTAMTPRFGRLAGAFARRFFTGFRFEAGDAERLRDLERRGAVVYVMRYSSRLDYFLFNWLFLQAGVRLSAFANGIRFYYYRPLGEAARLLVRGTFLRARRGFEGMRERGFVRTRQVARQGESLFLFLRTDKIGSRVRTRPRALRTARRDIDYLREVVDTAFAHDVPISLVPLALFWRKGSLSRRPFLNVFYGGPERPTDTWKVLSFLWNYRNLAVRVGEPIDLDRFVREHRERGPERVLKQVRRSLLIFLRREEKPVLGSALRPIERVEEAVLEDPAVRAAMAEADAGSSRWAPRAELRARRYLREIAAHPSPTMLAILDVIVTWMFRRLFARVEVNGLDRIVEAAKRSPLVLVPTHRSHFDYLILSWLFYERHLVPPLVAAGTNLSFWPLGPVFRRGGAFFLRRSFEGNRLYASVFRSYVQVLIKDGATQEFFIEGTRSRTGKTLQPRLGMLGMVVQAFSRGVRRDVQIVPVGFTYERLVEEGSMTDERRGSEKTAESLLALIRARRVLQNRFGAVTVCFGAPVSLAEWLGREGGEGEARLRASTESLADEICRRINGLITAGRSSVSATALLGSPARAVRVPEFRARVEEIAALLEVMGLARSENLRRNLAEGRPEAAAELLLQSGLVEEKTRSGGTLLQFSEAARDRLAYYRATLAPALAGPAVLGLVLRRSGRGGGEAVASVLAEASRWLDLLRLEYFPPGAELRARCFERLLRHFAARGWVEEDGEGRLRVTDEGWPRMLFLAAQIRPVLETYRVLLGAALDLELPTTRGALLAEARSTLEEQLLLGEALYSEAVCPTTLGNAFLMLVRDEILVCDGNPRDADAAVAAGPRWARLQALWDRVAQAIETR